MTTNDGRRKLVSHSSFVIRPLSRMNKVISMQHAIREFVHDGDTVAIEGFTHLICFAAAHEIIRQRKQDLTLCRLTPDMIYDQMIAAGVCKKLVFSYAGNPGVGSLQAFRRAVEKGEPRSIELDEFSHFGLVARYLAGAARLPFYPLKSYSGSDLPKVNSQIREMQSPFGDEKIFVVPPLNPDVAILHAQRADENGNTQIWGLTGVQKEAAFASQRVIVVVEELVSESVIRADPNRTMIPGLIVNAVVVEPFGAHPSYVQGMYDRDNAFYVEWDTISREAATLNAWLDEWVYGLNSRAEYVEKMRARLEKLKPGDAYAEPINYGAYT